MSPRKKRGRKPKAVPVSTTAPSTGLMPPPDTIPARTVSTPLPGEGPTPNPSPEKKKARQQQVAEVDKRTRNYAADFAAAFGGAQGFEEFTDTLDLVHFKPITVSTKNGYAEAKKVYLRFATLRYDGNEEKAISTIQPGCDFPPLKEMKAMFQWLATTGRSNLGIADVTGWSLNTVQKFKGNFTAMWYRETSVRVKKRVYTQLKLFLDDLAIEKGLITTKVREKKRIRPEDFECVRPSTIF